jgi:hypothetical protein
MSTYKFEIGDKVKTLSDVPLYGTIVEIYLKDDVTIYRINLDNYNLHIVGNENNIELNIE